MNPTDNLMGIVLSRMLNLFRKTQLNSPICDSQYGLRTIHGIKDIFGGLYIRANIIIINTRATYKQNHLNI